MQYKTYSRNTLELIDFGFIRDYSIDDDYLINNNSKAYLTAKTKAVIGDIIVLIKSNGPYHKGIITAVDNINYTISYKDVKEFFNNTIISPFRKEESENINYEAISFLINIIDYTYAKGEYCTFYNDTYLDNGTLNNDDILLANGNIRINAYETVKACFTSNEVKLNLKDLLIDLFEKYNIMIQFDINFNRAKTPAYANVIMTDNLLQVVENPSNRVETIDFTITAVKTNKVIIKDNIIAATFNYEEVQAPTATVAYIMNDAGDLLKTYYLLNDDTVSDIIPEGKFTIHPSKPVISNFTYNAEEGTSEDEQMYNLAVSQLNTGDYYHCIEVEISNTSKMIDFSLMQMGTSVVLVNEQGTINTVYTGRKETKQNLLTLIFGKARRNYTDKVILNLRRKKDK